MFAHITDIADADVQGWQSSIDVVLRRFAEYHDLEGAFGRRALTERAKGILMERHAIDENVAFAMLRERSRVDNRKLIDLAAAVVDPPGSCPSEPRSASRPEAPASIGTAHRPLADPRRRATVSPSASLSVERAGQQVEGMIEQGMKVARAEDAIEQVRLRTSAAAPVWPQRGHSLKAPA